MECYISLERNLNVDLTGIHFSKTLTESITIKILKLTSNMVYVDEKFLIMMTYYISLKWSRKKLLKDKVSENNDWNYFYLKTQTWYTSKKNFFCYWWYIIYRWKGLEKCDSMITISETLTNSFMLNLCRE